MGLYLATTSIGLEEILVEEIKLFCENENESIIIKETIKGGVLFTSNSNPNNIRKIRSIDNVFAFLTKSDSLPSQKEEGMNFIKNLINNINWNDALNLFLFWTKNFKIDQNGTEIDETNLKIDQYGTENVEKNLSVDQNKSENVEKNLNVHQNKPENVEKNLSVDQNKPQNVEKNLSIDQNEPENVDINLNVDPKKTEKDEKNYQIGQNGAKNDEKKFLKLPELSTFEKNFENIFGQQNNFCFRATCERKCLFQKKHQFSSVDVASTIGEKVIELFDWKVNMSKYDLEIIAWIVDSNIILTIPLIYYEMDENSENCEENNDKRKEKEIEKGKEAEKGIGIGIEKEKDKKIEKGKEKNANCDNLHVKNGNIFPSNAKNKVQARFHHAKRQLYSSRCYRKSLIRTSLKPSTAFALLNLSKIKLGDFVLDPMCGSGTIPLEASDWLNCHVASFGADIDDVALNAAHINSKCLQRKNNIEILKWSSLNIPFKENLIDKIICDMPFGRKCGSVKSREKNSPKIIKEIARVLKTGSGRAVLMSQSKSFQFEIQNNLKRLLNVEQHLKVDMEGMKVDVLVLNRTDISWSDHLNSNSNVHALPKKKNMERIENEKNESSSSKRAKSSKNS